jgi:hypothetical protein
LDLGGARARQADDAKLGLHSAALFLGDAHTKPALLGVSGVAVAGVAAAGAATGLSWPFYAACGVGAGQLAWQVAGLSTIISLWNFIFCYPWLVRSFFFMMRLLCALLE